ncbi:ABC transporter [Pholiota conissans]|uniref:ABC transporter n=1 Tax=Pholiota conissans TaxID=109636 RepID=A0A9P5ZCF6_9AGAR|nr:ABC transporter [Pholiota conissans]
MGSEKPPLFQPDTNAKGTTCVLQYTRKWWQHVPLTSWKVPPPPTYSIEDAALIPEADAGTFSILTFNWMTSLLNLGYSRPLEPSDLWKLQDERGSAHIAKLINESFDRRVLQAQEYNKRLANGEISPGLKGVWWTITGRRASKEKEWREKTGKKTASLAWALNDSVKWWFWSAGMFKLVGDLAQTTSPLVLKALITFVSESYFAHQFGERSPSVGKGVGLALGLLAMQVLSSFGTQHHNYRAMSTGVLIRGGLITAIYQRSLRLTSRARATLPNGQLVNHISTDVSRIDFCAGYFHAAWTSPIQLLLCLALLIANLGASALAGYAFLIFSIFLIGVVMGRYRILRNVCMVWTDKRAKALQEVLGGMKIIKLFAWEVPMLERISDFRNMEIGYVRSLLICRAAASAIGISMPALAAVFAFLTYSGTHHDLSPAIIFSSLTFFNMIRLPLMFLPISLTTIADAKNALGRIRLVFEAELLDDTVIIDENLGAAIEVKGASFTWDAPIATIINDKKPKPSDNAAPNKSTATGVLTKDKDTPEKEEPFKITNLNMTIARGSLIGIVGPVGSGKTSLLQGLFGEMRKISGNVAFGGSVAYCAQTAWIQNATIRENICFGRPFEEARYWNAVRDSCLGPDFEMLPHGDMTEVGENGISLSGGQKQRVNICRAIYCDTDIQIFDDPLSALDAHVGKKVFENVLLDEHQAGKTRVLIVEQGSYNELISQGKAFARLIAEFGTSETAEDKTTGDAAVPTSKAQDDDDAKLKDGLSGDNMMQTEERNVGAVSAEVYKVYFSAGNAKVILPILLLSIVANNGAAVLSSYWLVWWQEAKWNKSQGFYMGIYAALGVSQAVFAFLMGAMFALMTYFASRRLYKEASTRVMHAPMSFFDTTPLGRIMNRFAKDIDTMDNVLTDSMRVLMGILSYIISAVILISILLPWFLIGIGAICIAYVYITAYYRSSARELKRLDAILRSSVYSQFSESLSGLSTIRAYGEGERFELTNEKAVDIENRAYWMTTSNQNWLGLRVDMLGVCMTFIVAMLSIGSRFTMSPAQIGVLLSYSIATQQFFGFIVKGIADLENNMNSVERIMHYAKNVEQEAPYEYSDKKTPPSWPSQGHLELKNITLKYRPELPAVIKGISMDIRAGEKVGIVGRTGAGKSSIMIALERLVELESGSIMLDGIDISTIGLLELRSNIAVIPQDALLFAGTLRSNLDPFSIHDDATLWDALKRSHLVSSNGSRKNAGENNGGMQTPTNKYDLDTVVDAGGSNLSVGQRSLVSLARALVKNSKLIVLDEATASVDFETDHKVQQTIATEFKDRTILCIAHRLRTILSYDRICVLDAGLVAEFDSPANLYNNTNGIFRQMCDQSSITLDDILLAANPVDSSPSAFTDIGDLN